MSYKLYSAPDSANIVIHMILEQLEVEFDLLWVDRSRQEHKEAQYRQQLNPQGLIPVLVDADTPVFETAAIALYLSEKHRQLGPQGAGSAERSRFLQWLFYLSNTLHADLRVQFYPHRHVSDGAAIAALLEGTQSRVLGHFELIEAELEKNTAGPWFLGEELSILDFYLGALCRWSMLYPTASALGNGILDSNPCLLRLLAALEELPGVQRAMGLQTIKAPFFLDPTPPDLPAEQVSAS